MLPANYCRDFDHGYEDEPPDCIQEDIGRWHRRHFPKATLTHIVLKALEEAGELAKAHNEHALQWSQPWSLTAKETDAIGDIAIVLYALCDRAGEDFEAIVRQTWCEVESRSEERIQKGGAD